MKQCTQESDVWWEQYKQRYMNILWKLYLDQLSANLLWLYFKEVYNLICFNSFNNKRWHFYCISWIADTNKLFYSEVLFSELLKISPSILFYKIFRLFLFHLYCQLLKYPWHFGSGQIWGGGGNNWFNTVI